jgi:hypothetical protein
VTSLHSKANGRLQEQFASKSTLELEFQKFYKGTVDELLGELVQKFAELAQKFFTDTVTDLQREKRGLPESDPDTEETKKDSNSSKRRRQNLVCPSPVQFSD